MLVGVKRTDRLTECLADSVPRVRAYGDVGADPAPARIEADRVVGRGKYDARHLGEPGGLEQVVATDDVGIQNGIPRPFHREAAEMHDAVDARAGAFDRSPVGEIVCDDVRIVLK